MMRIIVIATSVLMTACGQTGSLYLPDESAETPVEIRGPNQPAEDDEKKKPEQPPGS